MVLATVCWWAWRLTPARADGGAQAPIALTWIELNDTRGISVWNYELSLDRGGITSPDKLIWSFFIDISWGIYRLCVVIAVWFIDWVLGFAWLPIVTTPLLTLSDALQTVVDQFGVQPLFATAAAALAATWMARGKWALGIFELFTSLIIAALAVGLFANPVDKVAGDDGLLISTRDTGLQLAAGLANNGDTSGDSTELREQITGTLIDTFLRLPTEMINFGTVVDGGGCEATYDDVLRKGPYGTDDDIRDAMSDCDLRLGAAAENPGPGQLLSTFVIGPAAAFLMIFALVLAGALLLAAVYALYQALRGIVTVVLAILPGGARGTLWQTLAELATALATVVFTVVFLTGYMLFLQGIFTGSSDGSFGIMATFFLVDVMIVVGIIMFWKGRKKLRRGADRLAAAMAKRPGTGPTALPSRKQFNPTDLYYKSRMAIGAGRLAVGGASAMGRGIGGAAGAAGGLAGKLGAAVSGWRARTHQDAAGASSPRQLAIGASRSSDQDFGPGSAPTGSPGGGPTGSPGGAPTTLPGGAAAAVRQRVSGARLAQSAGGRLMAWGARAAAAYMTGGTSSAVLAGVQVAGAAHRMLPPSPRRTALDGRLVRKALPAGSPGTQPTSGPQAPSSGHGGSPATSRPAMRSQGATGSPAGGVPAPTAARGPHRADAPVATGASSPAPTAPSSPTHRAPGAGGVTQAIAGEVMDSTSARPSRSPSPGATSPGATNNAARLRAELAGRRAATTRHRSAPNPGR
ncbi:hypothetical protein [Klenkia sp. PcliD-1-E]|uniref:hypothetical protein n=1 Tax=Klenkia sp. PcliD-1-E TaxID=2954492 RepID=UPI0020971213|nr:hypothetical protein [Klenkia sp. PcliD-1-E]MCO7219524.1 hypothetical protein [Klenkia sp. PcliD-1-E]